MHGAGAQERKFAARAGPSIARSGLHTVNKLLTLLLLRPPMCRASVGRRFREDKAVRSSYSKTRIMPCYAMFNSSALCVTSRRAWALGTIFSAYNNYYSDSCDLHMNLDHFALSHICDNCGLRQVRHIYQAATVECGCSQLAFT